MKSPLPYRIRAPLMQMSFPAFLSDFKGITDFHRQCLNGFLQPHPLPAHNSPLMEVPEHGSRSRAHCLQKHRKKKAQCSDCVFWDHLTRRTEKQQQFSAEGWHSNVLCSRQKHKPLKLARGPGRYGKWLFWLIWLCSSKNNRSACTWILADSHFQKSKRFWLVVPTRETFSAKEMYYQSSVSKQ